MYLGIHLDTYIIPYVKMPGISYPYLISIELLLLVSSYFYIIHLKKIVVDFLMLTIFVCYLAAKNSDIWKLI